MAITLFREKKRLKYLMTIMISLIFVVLFVVWFVFLREIPLPPTLIKPVPKKIEINWQVLQDPKLDELEPYPEIPTWEEEVGRENPFLPY